MKLEKHIEKIDDGKKLHRKTDPSLSLKSLHKVKKNIKKAFVLLETKNIHAGITLLQENIALSSRDSKTFDLLIERVL